MHSQSGNSFRDHIPEVWNFQDLGIRESKITDPRNAFTVRKSFKSHIPDVLFYRDPGITRSKFMDM